MSNQKFPNDVIHVQQGEIRTGFWTISTDELINADFGDRIHIANLVSCTVVSDRHETYQTGVGRAAGGVLGFALLGGIGAAAGLLAGGKRRIDETIVMCTLADGRIFTGEVSQITASKLHSIAQRNALNKQNTKTINQSINSSPEIIGEGDTHECPMCAETIKIKAKICKHCGYKIEEENNKRINELKNDPTIDFIFNISDGLKNYREAVKYGDSIPDEYVKEIIKCFSRVIDKNPNSSYRDLAAEVQQELSIEYISIINDLIREGFKFIRSRPKFEVENDYIIVRKKPNNTTNNT